MKVLICDDDELRRSHLISFLAASGLGSTLEISEARCADEVSELLAREYFDALFIDIVLPKREKESPSASNGFSTVRKICRSDRLQKPERIVGLTGYLDDIQQYREELAKLGVAVIEAKAYAKGWEREVLETLEYTASSQAQRGGEVVLDAVTVHGIRTYGQWQTRLNHLVRSRYPGANLYAHKYGYFSLLAFLIPYWRRREVSRLVTHLHAVLAGHRERSFIIFSHSFGTYLTTLALEELCRQGHRNVRRLVLSGSVLPSDYDWRFLTSSGVEVINDCAQDDLVLWLSEALVLGTGMAGKVGFLGIQNQTLMNRFKQGGHSSYFVGETFMERRWLPLLDANIPVAEFDERSEKGIVYHACEAFARSAGKVKAVAYACFFFAIALGSVRALAGT